MLKVQGWTIEYFKYKLGLRKICIIVFTLRSGLCVTHNSHCNFIQENFNDQFLVKADAPQMSVAQKRPINFWDQNTLP